MTMSLHAKSVTVQMPRGQVPFLVLRVSSTPTP